MWLMFLAFKVETRLKVSKTFPDLVYGAIWYLNSEPEDRFLVLFRR